MPRHLPDLLRPALVVEHDDPASSARTKRRREGLVEVFLRDRHAAHEFLEGHAGPDDVVHVVPQRHLLLAGHTGEPGGLVGRAVVLRESHLCRRPGDLGVEVGLRHPVLLLLQGLVNERAGDEDLEDLAAVPIEAHLLDVFHGDRLPIDQRGDARPCGRLRRIVEHVVDGRRVLQFLENLARGLATLPLSQFLGQLRADLLEGRPGRRQMAFALDHDELVGHLHHVGDLPRLEREGCPVEQRITGVQADRLHPAVGAGAADVDRALAGDRAELVGGLERLLP